MRQYSDFRELHKKVLHARRIVPRLAASNEGEIYWLKEPAKRFSRCQILRKGGYSSARL
jgi:hypothetical protein